MKEDGSQAQVDEKLSFKVIEFNKDAKRIILSHSRIHEDVKRAEKGESTATVEDADKKAAPKKAAKKKETPVAATLSAEKTTLGDIQSLSDLKDKMDSDAADKLAKNDKPKAVEATEIQAEDSTVEA